MRDHGANDFKVFGVPNSDPLFAEYKELKDVPSHYLREVEHFFSTYKQLEGIHVEPLGWAGVEEATAQVKESVERYLRSRK
jgi:inorganic pyrophosphatase